MRALQAEGHTNIVTRTHAELDLIDQRAVEAFFEQEKPEYVVLAAAKVGGILATSSYSARSSRQTMTSAIIDRQW